MNQLVSIFLLLLLVFCSIKKNQKQSSLKIKPNTVWLEEKQFQQVIIETKYTSTDEIKIKGKIYSKLIKEEVTYNFPDTTYTKNEVGYLRNSDRILYFLSKDESKETIIYNFNLVVDDFFFINGDSIKLTQIDTVQINGIPKVRQKFKSEFDNDILTIEGIGSNCGLFMNYFKGIGAKNYLKCFKSKETSFCFESNCECNNITSKFK